MQMNSLKSRLQMAAAILLLLGLALMVWYVLFRMPGQGKWPDGTLVSNFFGKQVKL